MHHDRQVGFLSAMVHLTINWPITFSFSCYRFSVEQVLSKILWPKSYCHVDCDITHTEAPVSISMLWVCPSRSMVTTKGLVAGFPVQNKWYWLCQGVSHSILNPLHCGTLDILVQTLGGLIISAPNDDVILQRHHWCSSRILHCSKLSKCP